MTLMKYEMQDISPRWEQEDDSVKIYNQDGKIIGMVCNSCGKMILQSENGLMMEEMASLSHTWGYFSDKDGLKQEFELCESCFDRITGMFQIPVDTAEQNEML